MSNVSVMRTMAQAPNTSRRAGWVTVMLVAFGACLLLEGYVRAFHALDYPPTLFRLSATRGWELQPNASVYSRYNRAIQINEHGQRGRNFAIPKPSGTQRVVMLGDSYVFGGGVSAAETLPKQLEAQLADAAVEVVNAGVPGYGPAQERALLAEVGFDYEPDLVLVGFYHNDLRPVAVPTPSLLRRAVWAVRPYAYSYDYLKAVQRRLSLALQPSAPPAADAVPDEWWAQAQAELARIFLLCEERRTAVAMVYVGVQRAPGVGERVRAWCVEADVPYYDVHSAYGTADLATLQLSPRDGHPTADANGMAARGVAEFLRTTPGLLTPPPAPAAAEPDHA